MGWFGRVLSRGYCAFCKAERNYILKKHIHIPEILLCSFFAFCLSAAIWTPFDPRGLVIFVLSLSVAETFIYSRWRSHIVCRMCGFDPVLYNSSPTRARNKVKAFYETQQENPAFLLSKSPLLEVKRESLRRKALRERVQRVKSAKSKEIAPPA